MNKSSKEFLERFLATSSPSGFESEAALVWKEWVSQHADSVAVDVHGNVVSTLNEEADTRVMLAGHCDEIGLMVTHIDDNGFVYFAAIGGVDAAVLPGMRVQFLGAAKVRGVIGRKPIHLMEKDERTKGVEIKDLWIDIGAKDKKQAAKQVQVGDAATVIAEYQMLMNDRVVSKAWDDKAGAFVVAEAMRIIAAQRSRLKVAVYGVATVQEELGVRGATTSGYGINPHAAIAIDVGFATDAPGLDKKVNGDIALGDGPILHRGANINMPLGAMLAKAARKLKVAVQWSAEARIPGTDADPLQITRGGVASALVSVPNRYMHTPVEMCSLKDLENTAKVVAETILAMPATPDFLPYR